MHRWATAAVLSGELRTSGSIGAQSVARRMKTHPVEVYGSRASARQVPMLAARLDEPGDSTVVNMLDALPEEDCEFYSDESRMLDWNGKICPAVAGSKEYLRFLGGNEQ